MVEGVKTGSLARIMFSASNQMKMGNRGLLAAVSTQGVVIWPSEIKKKKPTFCPKMSAVLHQSIDKGFGPTKRNAANPGRIFPNRRLAMAAVDYFLTLDGIKGESADDKHKGEIDIMSFSWGATNTGTHASGGGGGAGKVNFQDIHITKN